MNNTMAEQRPKKHFWTRLLRLPRSKTQAKLSNPPDENVPNFDNDIAQSSTMDFSSLSEVRRDSGILFLNKTTIGGNDMAFKEENKHVQFAPTPLNKYYKVDVKAAPSKRIDTDEDKENVKVNIVSKPKRPILRLDRSRSNQSRESVHNPVETTLVKAIFVDGPQVKTPTIQRTSTKLALIERKNASLPQLNVSSITKYGSLPRNSKIHTENMSQQSYPVSNSQETLSVMSQPFTKSTKVAEWQRRSLRHVQRQSCYDIFQNPKTFQGNEPLVNTNRQSLGEHQMKLFQKSTSSNPDFPLMSSQSMFSGQPMVHSQTSISNPVNRKLLYQKPVPSYSENSSALQPVNHPMRFTQRKRECAFPIPNKALNEVGLPNAMGGSESLKPHPNCSKSKNPHYIYLSETVSKSNHAENGIKNYSNGHKEYFDSSNNKKKIYSSKEVIPYQSSMSTTADRETLMFKNSAEQKFSTRIFINKTRKQAVKLSMYSQKRQLSNKLCKYKCKESDEGFSSMADDECSFNCSCSTCMARYAKYNKKDSMVKRFFSSNKENRYFFSIDINDKPSSTTEMETIQEHTQEVQAEIHHCQSPQEEKWYNCNDVLCQTPLKPTVTKSLEGNDKAKHDVGSPSKNAIESIYENITEIINSATKKNYKTEDVKRMFSTPICSPVKVRGTPKKLAFDATEAAKFSIESASDLAKSSPASVKSISFNDSVVLLQEIFQKLSQECKELLQPDVSSTSSASKTQDFFDSPISNKCVKDLVKNLQSKELSEADFANIIGSMAQNIFLETKAKRRISRLIHSKSFPDLRKKANPTPLTSGSLTCINSAVKNDCDNKKDNNPDSKNSKTTDGLGGNKEDNQQLPPVKVSDPSSTTLSTSGGDSSVGRTLPDGWSGTPSSSKSEDSESDLQLLEKAIRLGMGLGPNDENKSLFYAASPKKATKYKSRDVLSGKGKLKLKIYYNSGLVTVHIMRAAKLNWTLGKELNSYVKVCLVPDESKRVHWRTPVQKAQKHPRYDTKFSFEALEDDSSKRLLFSVWHRDYGRQRSELIGCMSFSLKHVMDPDHGVDGWYRLLKEGFGVQKHFAARTKQLQAIKPSC
ncbi:uncharacterized protein LOC129224846 [Uloborus diversus]|uniref:uncharacterized protein LOC129224846 n=1 Tax=Uloborus diversus TaxID=327109 RepID=UPI00240A93A2|nr:uncharacterized protein LOC129224846 [Uloborus diversus]